MQTVVSHRGQETFNVSIINYINSIAYVQRQIDKILQYILNAKVYVDNVITSARTFQQHLQDLRQLFELFTKFNITISSIKIFLRYSNVNLLDRKVNSFNLISSEDKLKVISNL